MRPAVLPGAFLCGIGQLRGDVNPVQRRDDPLQRDGDGQGNTNIVSGNFIHQEIHAVINETGIGETTGATYTLHANYHEVFDSPNVPAPDFTFGVKGRGHVISTTPELSFTGCIPSTSSSLAAENSRSPRTSKGTIALSSSVGAERQAASTAGSDRLRPGLRRMRHGPPPCAR